MRWIALVVCLAGCGGGQDVVGAPAPGTGGGGAGATGGGTQTSGGGAGGSGAACTPNRAFCDGAKLFMCTRSGTDAVLNTDCAAYASGSSNNPEGCFTTACPPWSANGACCRRTKPTCHMNLTAPAAVTVDTYDTYLQPYCTAPSACASDALSLSARIDAGGCGMLDRFLSLTIRRDKATVGQTLTLGAGSAVSLSLSAADSTQECSSWTGTVTWTADVPSWAVSVDATCAEADKGTISVTGTFSGDV